MLNIRVTEESVHICLYSTQLLLSPLQHVPVEATENVSSIRLRQGNVIVHYIRTRNYVRSRLIYHALFTRRSNDNERDRLMENFN